MLMVPLAWTQKACLALLLPERGCWKAKHRAEKRTLLRMAFKTVLTDPDNPTPQERIAELAAIFAGGFAHLRTHAGHDDRQRPGGPFC